MIGNMMDKFGIDNHTNTCATAADLAWELQQGHGVIVGVNSAELWETGPLAEIKHEICKACGLDNPIWTPADHAVTVTGIDMSDPDHPMVILNDSGVGATVQYPLDKFVDAWENSGCYYVATNAPLPSMMNVGSELSEFWGSLNLVDVAAGAAAFSAGAITGLFTDSLEAAAISGQVAGEVVYDLFGDESFARTI